MNITLLDSGVASAFYGNFSQLTPPQESSIEPLLSGRNLVLTSGTGSGKTEAVVAPLVSRYLRLARSEGDLVILYIAPTKALVNDIVKRLHLPLTKIGLVVGVRHGDHDDLKNSTTPQVLVTTPESLEVLLFRKDRALHTIRAIVVDEVHILYNTQRGLQLSILIRRLGQLVPTELQWALLSATIGNLSFVRDFLMGPKANADFLSFEASRFIDGQIRIVRDNASFVALMGKLVNGQATKLLVFTNSRRDCERIAGALQNVGALRDCTLAHYSSLSPDIRKDTESRFASLRTAICIATSTLELGIDIGDIDAVILWGVPSGVESFLQRIGRSNRRSKKTNVVCLVHPDSPDPLLDALRFAVLLDMATNGELYSREAFDIYGAVGQQCASIIAAEGGAFIRVADLCKVFGHRPYLSREVVETVLADLAMNGILQRHGYKNRYGADQGLYRLVDMKLIYGNFGIGSQSVAVFYDTKRLGEIPIVNLLRLRSGAAVRFAGQVWRVKKFSPDGIFLKPKTSAIDVIEFTYGGSAPGSDPYVTDRMWQIIHKNSRIHGWFTKDLRQLMTRFCSEVKARCVESEIPYKRTAGGVRYYTFAGQLVNRAIGLYSRKHDFKGDDISLLVPSLIDWTCIPASPLEYEEVFSLLFESTPQQSIFQKNLSIELQRKELVEEWIKDACIKRILGRLSGAKAVELELDLSHLQ